MADLFTLTLRDAATGTWFRFTRAAELLVARSVSELPDVLARVDRALALGHWTAGFLSYEAARGLDPAIATRIGGDFPLAVFGLFGSPETVAPPCPWQKATPLRLSRLTRSTTRREYLSALKAVQEAIHEGDTYQVNFTYRLSGQLASDPLDLFGRLVSAQHATYAAYGEYGPWALASATPELLFRKDGHRIYSRPMKSTAPRGAAGPEDLAAGLGLLSSLKERAEHLMIVDMVRNDLSRIALPGSVRVPDPFRLEAYPTVWQVTSRVEAETEASVSRILTALFPGASITGAPRVSTTHLIARLESTPRNLYTGSVGFAAPDGRAQFNIAIRTALIDTRTGSLEYGVGGGVVSDSRPDRELAEAALKARILRSPLSRFDLLETIRWNPDSGWVLLEEHLQRLAHSAAALGYQVDLVRVRQRLERHARGNAALRLRLLVSRAGRVRIQASSLERAPAFQNPVLAIAPASISSANPLLGHKTTHRDLYDRMRALCAQADDVILWNERGEVTESTWSNVFLKRGRHLLTPPLGSGLLPGVFRAHLLASGEASEEILTPDDLLAGDPVFLGNSVRGLYPAGSIVDRRPESTPRI